MRIATWALPALGVLCCSVAEVEAAAYVLGDSLGEGVAQVAQKAAHAKGLAKISVHIRGRKALEQIAQTPPVDTTQAPSSYYPAPPPLTAW